MSDLPTTTLGRTGVEVTRLGYGAMELRGGGVMIEPAAAASLLNAVLDAGINFIDTSPDYGDSEARIGEAISHRREEYFLASKCGCPINHPGHRAPHIFTRENVRAGVEQSLARMRTDHLDLVQFHASPSRGRMLERVAEDRLLDRRRYPVRMRPLRARLPIKQAVGALHGLDEALRQGVVAGVAPAAHGPAQAPLGQHRPVVRRRILPRFKGSSQQYGIEGFSWALDFTGH